MWKPFLFLSLVLILGLSNCETSPKLSPEEESILRKQIGQMMLIGFRGMQVDSVDQAILQQIETGAIGGVVLFDYDVVYKKPVRNIRSPQQVQKLITDLQARAQTPLLVAVDQEGGRVNRLKTKYGFLPSVSAGYLGQLNVLDSTSHYALGAARQLHQLGFNLNFAPVVDVNLNPDNPVIGKIERSYSAQADTVVAHASRVIQAMQSQDIVPTLKHFPGHGSSNDDSHKGFTDVSNLWQDVELVPYKHLLAKHPEAAVMSAHVFNNQLDSLYPATLSRKVITDILRGELGHKGVIFSDDMQMKAISALYDLRTSLQLAIEAGLDVLVFGNNLDYDPAIAETATNIIVELVQNGQIEPSRIEASYNRIMALKKAYNIIPE